MHWSKLLGVVVTAGVAAWAIGSLVSLLINPLDGQYSVASLAVVALLLVALVGTGIVGARNREWIRDPGYY